MKSLRHLESIPTTSKQETEGGPNRIYTKVAALAGASALFLTGCDIEGGSSNPDRFGVPNDGTNPIISVEIHPDARLRFDPVIPDLTEGGSINGNIIVELNDLKKPIDLTADARYRKDHDEFNGDWIGIPAADLASQLPDLTDELNKDKDGVIWVSTQKAGETKLSDSIESN